MPHPRVWTPAKKQEFVNMLREGVGKAKAAQTLGTTWRSAKLQMAQDEEFAEAVLGTMELAHDKVEKALYRKAVKGDVDAIRMYLTNRVPDEWRTVSQVQHTGPGGGPINIAIGATEALRNVLLGGDTRAPALGFINAELAPGTGGALEADREPRELGSGGGARDDRTDP